MNQRQSDAYVNVIKSVDITGFSDEDTGAGIAPWQPVSGSKVRCGEYFADGFSLTDTGHGRCDACHCKLHGGSAECD